RDAADEADGVDGDAQEELDGEVAHLGEVPHLFVGEVAGGGGAVVLGGQGGVARGGADHHHFLHALGGDDGGFDAGDGAGARGACLGGDGFEGEVACGVEDVGELRDLAALQAAERGGDAAADADGVGDVAEDELDGVEAAVELAVELLGVGGGGELDVLGP